MIHTDNEILHIVSCHDIAERIKSSIADYIVSIGNVQVNTIEFLL